MTEIYHKKTETTITRQQTGDQAEIHKTKKWTNQPSNKAKQTEMTHNNNRRQKTTKHKNYAQTKIFITTSTRKTKQHKQNTH